MAIQIRIKLGTRINKEAKKKVRCQFPKKLSTVKSGCHFNNTKNESTTTHGLEHHANYKLNDLTQDRIYDFSLKEINKNYSHPSSVY